MLNYKLPEVENLKKCYPVSVGLPSRHIGYVKLGMSILWHAIYTSHSPFFNLNSTLW